MNANLFALFRRSFQDKLDRTAIEMLDGTGFSYGDLDAASGRIAALLRGLGIGKGDRVAVQVEKTPQAVFLYLGCLRAGAVYLPLNTGYTAAEIEYFLSDAQPALFVCAPDALSQGQDLARRAGVPQVLTLGADGRGSLSENADKLPPDEDLAEVAETDLAAICYTSGTTGRSKGAMITHGNLASNAQTLHKIWAFQDGDVLLHVLPIFHVHGLFVALNTALLNASKILFLPKFDPDQVIAALPGASIMMGVPTFYVRLLTHPGFGREICAHMRLFISGSAPLLVETFSSFAERTGHVILERYGMTEAGMITSNPYDGERVAGTVGFALPDVQIRLAAEDGRILPPGEIGVLEIKGPNVFLGYWQMPDKTAAEFREDGFFITGDLAQIAADGRVTIVGRAKDLIISGGYNVYPKEIEMVLDDLPGVEEAAVIGLPHSDFGEAVTAVVVRKPGATVTEAELIAQARGQLAAYKLPKQVHFVESLPRNTMGKVQKSLLRQKFA